MITLGIERIATARELVDQMAPERKRNDLKSYREKVFISKAELARKAGISAATVDRIEKGNVVGWKREGKSFWRLGWNYLKLEKYSGMIIKI